MCFFVGGKNAKGQIMGWGGNQGNAVSIVPFNGADIDGYYWPSKLVMVSRLNRTHPQNVTTCLLLPALRQQA